MIFIPAEVAKCLSLRIADIVEYSPTKEAFIRAIGAHNVATLDEIKDLYLYDFGIFIELLPDEEEKAVLENNIQVALGQKLIDLDDAIDLRDCRNTKLANQLLKVKRKKKMQRDQMIAQQNMQAQASANAQAQQAAAQAEMQKNNAKAQLDSQLEAQKNQLKVQYLNQEARVKKELMVLEFDLNMKMKGEERSIDRKLENIREDRKDARLDKQNEHQQKLANSRKEGESVKRFESSGNDIVTGGSNMERFGL